MAMALAVAMVACSGAVGKPGEAGQAGQPGAPAPNLIPFAKAMFDPVTVVVGGEDAIVDVAANFHDPDGGPLMFEAAYEPEGVVKIALAEGILTITPLAEGEATITVTANDPGRWKYTCDDHGYCCTRRNDATDVGRNSAKRGFC